MFLYPWTVMLLSGITSSAVALRPVRQSGHLLPGIQLSYWDPGDTDVGVMSPGKEKLFNTGEYNAIFKRKKYTQSVSPHQYPPIMSHQSRMRLEEQPNTDTFKNMLVPDEQRQTIGNRANPSTKSTYYNNDNVNAIADIYSSNTREAFPHSPYKKLSIKSEPITPILPRLQRNQNLDNIRSSTTHRFFQKNPIDKPDKAKGSRMESLPTKYFYYKHKNEIDHPKNIREKYLPSMNRKFPNFTGYQHIHTPEGITDRRIDSARGDIQRSTLKKPEDDIQRNMNTGKRSEHTFLENINGIEHYSQILTSKQSPSSSTSGRNLIFPARYHSSQRPDDPGNSTRQGSKTDAQTERSSTSSIHEDINSLPVFNTGEGNMQSLFPISDTRDANYPIPNAYVVFVPEGIVVPKHKNLDQFSMYFDVEDHSISEKETTIIMDQHTSQRVEGALLAYGPVGIVTADGVIPILSSDVTDTLPQSTTEAPHQPPSTTQSDVDDIDIYIPGSKIITNIYENGLKTSSTTPNTTQLHSTQDLEMLIKEMNQVTSGRRQIRENQSTYVTQNKINEDIHPIYEKGTILDVDPKSYFLTYKGIREFPPIILDHHSLKHPQSVLTTYPGKKRRSIHKLNRRRAPKSQRYSRKRAQVHHPVVRSRMGKLKSRQQTIPASSPSINPSHLSPSTSTTKYQKPGLFNHDSEQPLVGNLGQFRNVRSLNFNIHGTNLQHEQIVSSVTPSQQMNTIPSSQMLEKVADEIEQPSQRQKSDVNNNLLSSSPTPGSQSAYSLPTKVNNDALNKTVERNFGGDTTMHHFSSSLPGVTHPSQNGTDHDHKKMQLKSKFSVQKKEMQHKGLIKLGQLIYIKINKSKCLNRKFFGDQYLNDLVDFIIDVTNHNIKARGKANMTIPDISEEFSKTEFGIEVNGEFTATDGWFNDLSSLYRTADVVVSRSENTLSIRFGIALRKIQFGFGHYEAKLSGMDVGGQVTGEVKSNSMSVKVSTTINDDNTCTISLDDFKMNELGDIDLNITGLGAPQWLVNKISSWLIDMYKDDIIQKVQNEIMSQVNGVLSRVKC
ncbi:uncharacterized protein [Anabrus simplex]|uniref:uncharacterized protein n=1 Tax=Anabrus simplex TaxID=316456 RepID=UPI0035A3C1F7